MPLLPLIPVIWIEPAWKMILSNKAILLILWELFPGQPNLLAAGHTPPEGAGEEAVARPRGRQRLDPRARHRGRRPGPYDDAGFVYQAYADLGGYDGMRPVIGSWVIGDCPAGIGIHETPGYVTGNAARFVPHVVDA